MNSADKIIVALDFDSEEEVIKLLDQLPQASFVKVGMELFYSTRSGLISRLKDRGLKVFLDLKIHDIPNTAYGAVSVLSRLECDMINVHCAGGLEMMQRAREALQGDTKLIGVTQLTSTSRQVLNQQLRIEGSVEECVLHYAHLAKQAGLHGVVCSPREVRLLKAELGKEFLAVTPGVRPRGDGLQDQKRVMAPKDAVLAGSDYLVIGRPITKSNDPARAFADILKEIEGGYYEGDHHLI
ncbi:MAG: orotidine-5'-phosphate decarboxylase [Firmicutes bacterium]|nr:orotidine-5'-phosphate decarboxylase [Bacillota bacterium]